MSVWNEGGRHDPAHHRTPRAEYLVYFVLIFCLGVPFAALGWALELVRTGRMPALGPFARAWHDARIVTPMIFRP